MAGVSRLCLGCNKPIPKAGGRRRCGPCEAGRSRDRPWYRTPGYRAAQVDAQQQIGAPCPRCGVPMIGAHRPSVDHIQPVAAGGSWSGPFEVVCLPCNISKLDASSNE